MSTHGLLLVTMQPRPGLSLDEFHEWYNNEHGPTRLRMPSIFSTGQRFRATDGLQPTFVAIYDVVDMPALATPVYTDLRAHRTPREAATIGQVDVVRHIYDCVSAQVAPDFVPAEQVSDEEANGRVLVYVDVSLTDAPGAEDNVVRWYQEEHFGMLSKVPGWLRSRLFRTSSLDGGPLRLASLHEYRRENGLGGPQHKASMATTWRDEIFAKYLGDKSRRTYELFYTFGPAPRDLTHLAALPADKAFTSVDGKTITTPVAEGKTAMIRSYVTAPDGLEIPYVLEGNPAPDAPTVAFSNSLLTSMAMWDGVVALLKAQRPDLRILRYDTRGRHSIPSPPVPATMEMLADDLHAVLVALRIPKLHALIGVSLGGATTLQFALKYPDEVAKFVACDCNIGGSPANTNAWKERIALAEGSPDGMQKLADVTVSRWFHPNTAADKKQAMIAMVAANTLEGFKYGCQALWTFDLREAAKTCRVPGLFVAGENDGNGALVKAMDGFRTSVKQADEGVVELRVVPEAGHLPMYEQPEKFWDKVKEFL